ncbi:MAG: 4-phosphoerythronate dehydrogenase [Ignavibacteriaceae bacterium]|jgi:erythronate-4-phosphate dehydrogenase|nr:4-phosphoerythronate dehydrogenase [Ignavibacteriaceae bacterium]
MKIIVDENINFGKEAFSTLGEVTLVNGRKVTNEQLKNADALIVRSITKVNKELLQRSNIKFVGTATIGTDHVDKNYLEENNIAFADAAGCNSQSVTEYVLAAISQIYNKNGLTLSGKSIGVIGVGNIGSKVARLFSSLGLRVVKNDPPLQRKAERELATNDYFSLDEAIACDIITCHVPLNFSGEDKTYHLIDESRLAQLKPGTLLINSSRGPVIDNDALLKRLQSKKDIFTVLDVWETEPNINTELMKMTDLASAHIAGYSYEGKVNGTTIIYNKLAQFLGVEPVYKVPENPVSDNIIELTGDETFEEKIEKIISKSYQITLDDRNLREAPDRFDQLRKEYRIRRELSNYIIKENGKYITLAGIKR